MSDTSPTPAAGGGRASGYLAGDLLPDRSWNGVDVITIDAEGAEAMLRRGGNHAASQTPSIRIREPALLASRMTALLLQEARVGTGHR